MTDPHSAPIWAPLHAHRRALRRHIGLVAPTVLGRTRERLGGAQVRVLDVGCGTMPYRSLFLETGLCAEYVGADVETSAGEATIRIDSKTQQIAAESESFDVVVHFQTLEHVPDTESFLSECRRILRPDGAMFCTVPFLFEYHAVPGDYYRWSAEGLCRTLEKAGFGLERVEAVETDWESALGVLELVVARRFGYIVTKPLFLLLNLMSRLPLGPRQALCPMTYGAIARKVAGL